ncbi:MAG: agmatinase [Armatimonadota bacterium]|nr:agmatinase [Armatimonadota bacterium]MDR7450462.1 agmatinase [Armatimonadota bacterium]MDR7466955.1 agmatinase [Armatimonadota bacterium]MDR7493503.1 agmatinase [Armatimonadota bacterium]MDR7498768.1 agmatinase [Armatimonadota bacterium]
MTFLGTRAQARPRVVIVGAPYDATSSFRSGSRHAPAAIRWASQSIETYSPVLRADLEEAGAADGGDLDLERLTPEEAVDRVADRVAGLGDTRPFLIGGEHTITLGAVRSLAARYPDLAVLQVDAHTDLRDTYEGRQVCHATVMRRILEVLRPDAVAAIGIRAGTAEEFTMADSLRWCSREPAIPAEVWSWLAGRHVYVTIDIDAIDPAEAPGTGNPEPEGVSARDLLGLVRRLGDLPVVGCDLVEVSPPYDPSGRTAVLAAVLIRECLLALGVRRPA